MIRIVDNKKTKSVLVTGDHSEVMLLYCIWQTIVWPEWMNYMKLTEQTAIRDFRAARKSITDSGDIRLSGAEPIFREALTEAISRCEALEIVVYYVTTDIPSQGKEKKQVTS